jgi:hypothetical protein
MTATLSLDARRRAPLGREELRRQLLALVLAFVLVWYTFVVPAGPPAASPRRVSPEDEGHDGEVRSATPRAVKDEERRVEDLDWPEYIYP